MPLRSGRRPAPSDGRSSSWRRGARVFVVAWPLGPSGQGDVHDRLVQSLPSREAARPRRPAASSSRGAPRRARRLVEPEVRAPAIVRSAPSGERRIAQYSIAARLPSTTGPPNQQRTSSSSSNARVTYSRAVDTSRKGCERYGASGGIATRSGRRPSPATPFPGFDPGASCVVRFHVSSGKVDSARRGGVGDADLGPLALRGVVEHHEAVGARRRDGLAPVAAASSNRVSLIRGDSSSIHMRAPPAPQQKDRSRFRGISSISPPITARGASNSPLCRPR